MIGNEVIATTNEDTVDRFRNNARMQRFVSKLMYTAGGLGSVNTLNNYLDHGLDTTTILSAVSSACFLFSGFGMNVAANYSEQTANTLDQTPLHQVSSPEQ